MVQRVIPTAIEYSSLMVFVIVLFAFYKDFMMKMMMTIWRWYGDNDDVDDNDG